MTVAQIFSSVGADALARDLRSGPYPETVEVGFNVLFVDTGARKLLIDTGTGQGRLLENLSRMNLAPEAIDTVILTHGDGDHIGGISHFQNARFVLTPEAWASWTEPGRCAEMVEQFVKLFRGKLPEDQLAQRAAARQRYGQAVLPALRERVDLVEPETECLPGVRLVPAPGHRSDHTAVEICSQGKTLLHVVDALRHPLQAAHPDWISFIDSFPDQVGPTCRALLGRAATNDALVFAAHLTFPGLGHVRREGQAWAWEAAPPQARLGT